MRSLALLAALAAASAPSAVHARLFWQTYGATVPSGEGCGAGCAWNLNSDYFVPRTCETGHYDLFSPCKVDHYRSPACRYLHPVNCGYCTPYGPCHYKWRDHVYKKFCGCTPLACTHGPWKLEKCCKHCPTPCTGVGCCHCGECGLGNGVLTDGGCSPVGVQGYAGDLELPNVEPLGGELLGTIQAFPMGLAGARGMAPGMQGGMPGMPAMGMGAGMQGGAFMQAPPAAALSPAMSAVLGAGPPALTMPTLGN
jgi:hypothetical protein